MAKAVESDAAFLGRIRPPFIKRADRARLMRMMAEEARQLGDVEAADRLLRDLGK